jgi:hypothetical protein
MFTRIRLGKFHDQGMSNHCQDMKTTLFPVSHTDFKIEPEERKPFLHYVTRAMRRIRASLSRQAA